MHRMWTRIAIALVQGGLLWWLYRSIEAESWPGTDPGWLIGLIAPAVLVPFAHYLIEDLARDRRALWTLAALALALFGFGWHHGAWTATEPYAIEGSLAFTLALAILVFHALPFVQCRLATGRWQPRYPDLFTFAWRNALLLAFGGVFTGVLWLLLWLWGALFGMLGITLFSDLFTEAYFAIPATTVAAGAGMQLAGSVERLQSLLRTQLLTMLKWLAPLAILILALFTVTLLVKSPELLLEQRRVISAAWLLWLVALTVALLNAAYQDGAAQAPYPGWLGRAIRWVVPLLVVVAALAFFAIAVRVHSYGLTVARAWALLVAAIAIAYAAGYAWTALRGRSWMAGMGAINVGVALGTVTMLTLMLSPLLSPERLSAASQHARVLQSQEGDAFTYLRFGSGRYGRERLQRLAAIADHPAADAIRQAAAAELKRENRWGGLGHAVALSPAQFEAFPAGTAPPPALLQALREDEGRRFVLQQCAAESPCPLLFVDLDRDGSDEVLVFSQYGTVAAHREGERWVVHTRAPLDMAFTDLARLRKALAEGRFAVRDPQYQLLEIEGQLYLLEEPAEVTADEPCEDADAKVPSGASARGPR
jgi:hypothetical protein